MPKTSYALLSGVRSHRIAIPRLDDDDGKPSACHLCHLDRDDWARDVGMRGDAGVRAIVADALGAEGGSRNEAYAAALLDTLSNDPYAAVRFIARRSRAKLHVATLSQFPIAVRDDRAIMIAE
jgi:hypothetical protein